MATEKKPKHKVGDIVIIKERTENQHMYRFGFMDEMAELHGKRLEITRVSSYSYGEATGKLPDDEFEYHLRGSSFSWSSSMFEDSSESSLSCISEYSSDSNIDAFIRKKVCPELDFNL